MIDSHELEHEILGLDKRIKRLVIENAPVGGGGGGGVGVETDPVFSASEAANFVAGDKANLDNQSGVNTGDQDLSGYLTLDQTTPQTITGGVPIGLEGSYTHKIIFNMIGTADEQAWVQVPYDCTITSYELTADQSGSIVIDLWVDTYGNFPPTVADTITASAKPTLSSAQKATDSTLTGWTKTLTAGDYLLANVDSASTLEKAVLIINVTRS